MLTNTHYHSAPLKNKYTYNTTSTLQLPTHSHTVVTPGFVDEHRGQAAGKIEQQHGRSNPPNNQRLYSSKNPADMNQIQNKLRDNRTTSMLQEVAGRQLQRRHSLYFTNQTQA